MGNFILNILKSNMTELFSPRPGNMDENGCQRAASVKEENVMAFQRVQRT